jgi:nitrate/nitrite transport system substrate-binding protein
MGASGAAVAAPGLLAACGGGDDGEADSVASNSGAASSAGPRGSGQKISIGFIALTDASSVIMAKELGYFAKYGLNVDVVKQASWASTRDNLLTGGIDCAHCLFGMPFSVYTGVGGQAGAELHIAMMLNHNGQAITLSKDGFGGGKAAYGDLSGARNAIEDLRSKKEATFAMTFPGGTHDLWLRYWLAATGVDQKTLKIITIPPAQMVANMKVDSMDGFCVGEPWGGVAVKEDIGFTHITTQDMWTDHPEKALVVNPTFASTRRDDLKLVMRAVLEASQYIDLPENKAEVAKEVGASAYVNASSDVIDARLGGDYDLGDDQGSKTFTEDTMLFYNNGLVNSPRKSHAVWFMTQYVRFGYLPELPDVSAIADKLILSDLYAEVAREMSITIPDDSMAPFTVKLDNVTFDPSDPSGYLKTYGGDL